MGAPLKWFPYYVDDIETDEDFDSLSLEEQGAYHVMLRWQWREGSIPASPVAIARKLTVRSASAQPSLSERTAIAKRLLKLFFRPHNPGAVRSQKRMVNERLAELYVAQIGKSEKARAAAILSHRGRQINGQRTHGARRADA